VPARDFRTRTITCCCAARRDLLLCPLLRLLPRGGDLQQRLLARLLYILLRRLLRQLLRGGNLLLRPLLRLLLLLLRLVSLLPAAVQLRSPAEQQ
jgi:hypothetical protein